MTGLPANTRVWLAAGHTDMRRGFDGLSGMVQTALAANPYSGHVFAFRGKRGDLIKILWWDGQGLCLLAKRLERGRFVWPQAESGSVSLTPAQLSMLLELNGGEVECRAFGKYEHSNCHLTVAAFAMDRLESCKAIGF